jgi:ADP-ribose pyrophosphatase
VHAPVLGSPARMRVKAIEIVEDRTAAARCDEGFLRLRRYRARNRRDDGSTSPEYPIDVVDRATLDAVGACLWAPSPTGVRVLTRAGLRPAAAFRSGRPTALPEGAHHLHEEIVAGVVEPGEQGLAALRRRAAEEALEEAGLTIAPERFTLLGGPLFLHAGVSSDKVHLLAAEAPRVEGEGPLDAPPLGDGSPMEEGAVLRWRLLPDAIAACERGEIQDAMTEVALRRLAARLAAH